MKRIIDVFKPMFVIDINNPEKVYHGNIPTDISLHLKTMTVQTFANGVPKINDLKEGEILYRYSSNRGTIYKIEPEEKIIPEGIPTDVVEWLGSEESLSEEDIKKYPDSFEDKEAAKEYIGWTLSETKVHSFDAEKGSIETDFILISPDGDFYTVTCGYYTAVGGYQWYQDYVQLEKHIVKPKYKSLTLDDDTVAALKVLMDITKHLQSSSKAHIPVEVNNGLRKIVKKLEEI